MPFLPIKNLLGNGCYYNIKIGTKRIFKLLNGLLNGILS